MNLNKLSKVVAAIQYRSLCTTQHRPIVQKWRQERGLPLNPNAYGILTDKPDYTYLDGRPTPCGTRQKNRVLKHREITGKIIELSREVDFAVGRHDRLQKEELKRKEDVLRGKLKPKGHC